MPTTWSITIGGVSVTDPAHFNTRKVARGSLSVSQALGGRRSGSLTIHSENGLYEPATGAEVVITRDSFKLYGGFIWSRRKLIRAGTSLISWDLTLVDYNVIADRRVAGERSWFDQTGGTILTDIVTLDLTAEDVTATTVSTGSVIEGEFKLVGFPSVSDAANAVCARTDSQWYIDKDKKFRYFSASTLGYSATFDITKDNASEITPTESQEEYANKVKLKLAQYLMPEATETFNKDHASYPIDGERKEFAVPYPIASAPAIKVNGTPVEVGNSDNEADVAKPWFWSPGSQFIVQNATGLALGRVSEETVQSPITDTMEVTYVGVGQLTVDATNDDEVAARAAVEGGSGFHIRVVDIADQTSLQKANELAASILASIDELPTSITYRTNSILEPACDTLKPGDRQMVLGTEYVVRSVKWQDEARGDVLWLEAEVVRGPMLQDLPGLLKDLATGGNTIPSAAPVGDSTTVDIPATEGDNLIPNASFEALRSGWTTDTELEARTSVETTGSAHGTHHLKIAEGPDTGSIYTGQIAVNEALPLIFEGQYKRTGLVCTSLYITARFFDGAGADMGGALDCAIASGTDADWALFSVAGSVPSGAIYARVFAYSGTHTAGDLQVDGLSLRRFSSMSAPPAPASATTAISQDSAGHVYAHTTWTQPGDTGSAVGTIRFASFYADDTITTPLNDPPNQLNWDLGLATSSADDDFPGPASGCWIEIWVANLNGDLQPGPFAKSSRFELQPGTEISGSAGDVTLDATYHPKTWTGDVLTIGQRYAPYYPGPAPSRLTPTIGAYCSIESGDVVTPALDVPYTQNSEIDPPDNLQPFEVSISKAEIMSGTPDESGNYTIYVHACAYEPGGRVAFRKYPLQASSATQAIVVTAAELATAVPLPDPVAPTSPTLTVDNSTFPDFFIARAGWTPGSGDLSGTFQYRLQWFFTNTPTPAPNSSSAWSRDSVVYGGANTTFTSDPWPKDADAPLYVWYRIRSEQGSKNSSWVYLSSGVVANADSHTKRPDQPASGDFSLSILGYSKDSADAASQVKMRFTVSTPQTADHTELRMWSGGIPSPVDLARFEAIVKGSGSYDFWWPRVEAGETVYYTAVNCPSPNYRVSPAADNTWKTLAIPAVGQPGAVTGYSVTASTAYKIAGVLHIDITYTFTPPSGTDFMELHLYREQYSDATFTTRVGAAYTAWNPMVLTKSDISRAVACSDYIEYWKYYFVPVNWLGIENTAATVTYNATFPKNTGMDSGDLSNLGPGFYIDAGKLASASHNDLLDGNFEGGGTGWNLYGGATVAAGYGDDGSKGARAQVGQAVDQYLVCSPNTWYRFSWRARRNSSVAPVAYIAWYKSDGSFVSWTTNTSLPTVLDTAVPPNPIYASYSIVAKSPATATRAQVVGAFLSGGGTGYCDVDSATWDGLPNPGSGQAYDSTGNLINTAVGAMKNGNFGAGLADWYTSDSSWALLALDGNFILNPNGNPGNCCQIQAPSSGSARQLVQDTPAIPGQTYRASGTFWNATNGDCYVGVAFIDAAGNPIATGLPDTKITVGSGWDGYSNGKKAPAGTSKVRWKCYTFGGTVGSLYVDNASIDSAPGLTGPMSYDGTGQAVLNLDPTYMVVDTSSGTPKLTPKFLEIFGAAASSDLFELVGSKYSIKTNAVFANLVAAALALITDTLIVGTASTYVKIDKTGSISLVTPGGTATLSVGSFEVNAVRTAILEAGTMGDGVNYGFTVPSNPSSPARFTKPVTFSSTATFSGGVSGIPTVPTLPGLGTGLRVLTTYNGADPAWQNLVMGSIGGLLDAMSAKLDANDVSGTFTTNDGKTVTVTNGRVTAIA